MDTRLIAFAVCGHDFSVRLGDVRRVVPVPRLVAPAGAPRFLEGFFDLHGEEVAVIRVDRLLDLGEEILGIYAPLLVIDAPQGLAALHVGAIRGIVRPAEMHALDPDASFNGCAIGRFDEAGRSTYLLAPDRMLLAEEHARIAFHRRALRRRVEVAAPESIHVS